MDVAGTKDMDSLKYQPGPKLVISGHTREGPANVENVLRDMIIARPS